MGKLVPYKPRDIELLMVSFAALLISALFHTGPGLIIVAGNVVARALAVFAMLRIFLLLDRSTESQAWKRGLHDFLQVLLGIGIVMAVV
jgi:hypothetical protein